MKQLKGQGRLTKLITSSAAMLNRNLFSTMVHDVRQLERLANRVNNYQTTALKLVSFSSSIDYPEQVLSILSFLRHVGTPSSWTIYSDGSYTNEKMKVIQTALPFVHVIRQHVDESYFEANTLKENLEPYKHELHDFARKHVLGKRLSLYLNHAINTPTLFLDSDIVFYARSSLLRTSFISTNQGWFLSDQEGWNSLDSRYIASKKSDEYPINAGFFLVKNELVNVYNGLNFLKNVNRTYEYFTEQTVMHILLTSNKHKPLDPNLFIVNTCDQFDFSYGFTRDKIAIRHYTSPVRHKMWQRNWKWQLSLI